MEGLDDKQLVSMAKYAEQADRYDDMVKFMKEFTIRKKNLTVDERNLLSVAYKNVVGAKRSAVRIIMSIEAKEEGKGKEHIKDYKDSIKKKVMDICFEMLELIEQHLLPNIEGGECEKTDATVFYQKMKGDYFRYLVEVSGDDDTEKHKESSKKAYEDATESASDLASTHPIKLGLALNCSVFYYEIMNDPEKACHLAKEAFDAAIADLDSLKDDSYKDSTLIMQLLRDNLTLWTSEKQDDNADE